MKIAFTDDVVYAYASGNPAATGGAERFQWLLARALATRGWDVTVGVRNVIAPGDQRVIDGVQFVGLSRKHILFAWRDLFLAERPDWWYWQGAEHLWGPGVAMANTCGVRTIFSAAFDTDVHPRRALFRRQRWWPLYAWGLSWNDIIFVQHTGQFNDLPLAWQGKASVLPSVVGQSPSFKPHSERSPYVVWAAMLRQPKRPDVLIELARQTPELRFVVCGGTTTHRCPPGYGEQMVAALKATPNIEFLGQVAPEKTLQIIAEASLLLSTSDEEGFPSTFLEAWAHGTPVVSLKIDPDRIIAQKGLGSVSGTLEQAVTDIRGLLCSQPQRDEIAVRARRYVADHHSETAVVNAFEQGVMTNTRRERSFLHTGFRNLWAR